MKNQNQHILVEIIDQGIGISEEDQKRLFMPYHQVETRPAAISRNRSGVSGLQTDHSGPPRADLGGEPIGQGL